MANPITEDMVMNLIFRTGQFAEAANNVLARFDDLDRGMRNVEKSTSFLNRTLSVFVANLGVKVVEAATRAFGVLKQGFDRFIEFAKGATLESARIEVQWRVLSATAARMGVTFGEVEESIGALRAAGIKTSEALQVMTQWLTAGLPADRLQELSRAAQDLAVVLGVDSTQSMERFNWFVQTGNSELLRTVGIMSTSTQMEEQFAASIGKTREQLSDKERRLARVQGLLEATAAYAGSYERSLKDPFKRMTSLVREFSNVVEAVGAVFVPIFGAAVDIISDLLEKIERLFRVTKKEAKETGREIGEWKEGFLRLRAVVTAFANWFMSLWERLISGFNEQTESMMDRFVNAIIRGVRAAADALRKFARFLASVFGGRAPAEVTAETISRTRPEERPTPARPPAPATEAVAVMADPERAAKLRAKPVSPAAAKDVARYNELMAKLVDWNKKLAAATAAVAKARAAFAKAEEALEKASEKVYDIRRKIQKLEVSWAEIPERFIRGRKRQLQMELQAAEHEEHERRKEADAARERLQAAEAYQREVQRMMDSLRREAEKLGESIARQTEKYQEWLTALAEAEKLVPVEAVKAVADEFESLDDLTAQYLEEIERQLLPAFADVEESVASIADNLGRAWEKAKGMAGDVWNFLTNIKDWFDGLPDWAIKLLMGAIALKLLPIGGDALRGALILAFKTAGLIVSTGAGGLAAGALLATLAFALYPLVDEEVRAAWSKAIEELVAGNIAEAMKAGAEAAGKHMERLPVAAEKLPLIGPSLAWAKVWLETVDDIIDGITNLFQSRRSEVEAAVEEGVEEPAITTFERMAEEIVGTSIVPEMVEEIVGWFEQLTISLSPWLDQLTSKFNVLARAIEGLPPLPTDLIAFDAGQLKIVNVDLRGATFGDGISESDIRNWIWQALRDLMD